MVDYVLVHGAWGGGWLFNETAEALRAAGHRVLIAQLTGLGARAHLANPSIDLEVHIEDVVRQIEDAQMTNVVLVGHSYGGMVITGVAGSIGGAVAHLVYLDAFLPQDGQSLWDLTGEWEHEHYINGQRETPGLTAPLPGIGLDGQLTHHPLLTLLQPVKFTGREHEISKWSYIFTTGWEPSPFRQFHDRVKADAAWSVHEIECGHWVMAEKFEEMMEILLSASQRMTVRNPTY